MSTRRHPHLPPVWLMALALVAVAANLRTAMASVPPPNDVMRRCQMMRPVLGLMAERML